MGKAGLQRVFAAIFLCPKRENAQQTALFYFAGEWERNEDAQTMERQKSRTAQQIAMPFCKYEVAFL